MASVELTKTPSFMAPADRATGAPVQKKPPLEKEAQDTRPGFAEAIQEGRSSQETKSEKRVDSHKGEREPLEEVPLMGPAMMQGGQEEPLDQNLLVEARPKMPLAEAPDLALKPSDQLMPEEALLQEGELLEGVMDLKNTPEEAALDSQEIRDLFSQDGEERSLPPKLGMPAPTSFEKIEAPVQESEEALAPMGFLAEQNTGAQEEGLQQDFSEFSSFDQITGKSLPASAVPRDMTPTFIQTLSKENYPSPVQQVLNSVQMVQKPEATEFTIQVQPGGEQITVHVKFEGDQTIAHITSSSREMLSVLQAPHAEADLKNMLQQHGDQQPPELFFLFQDADSGQQFKNPTKDQSLQGDGVSQEGGVEASAVLKTQEMEQYEGLHLQYV